jgi:hypothetical protein
LNRAVSWVNVIEGFVVFMVSNVTQLGEGVKPNIIAEMKSPHPFSLESDVSESTISVNRPTSRLCLSSNRALLTASSLLPILIV